MNAPIRAHKRQLKPEERLAHKISDTPVRELTHFLHQQRGGRMTTALQLIAKTMFANYSEEERAP